MQDVSDVTSVILLLPYYIATKNIYYEHNFRSRNSVCLGDPDVKIKGPNEAKITKKEASGNGVTITYLPVTPGEYTIDIKHKGKAIQGSPFNAKVTGSSIYLHIIHSCIFFRSFIVFALPVLLNSR